MDLSTENFLLALPRFTVKRGLRNAIYTDNVQTFHAANRELRELCTVLSAAKTHQYFEENGIRWKFIRPRSAWWGGWWERVVGTTKRCLRNVLGCSQVDEEEFHNILVGTEAALNSRPVIHDDDNETLTPAHFLTGGKQTTIPHGPEPIRTENLTKSFRQHQKLTEDLWRRWQREYLLQLRNYQEIRRPARQGPKFKVGDIVLLQEERCRDTCKRKPGSTNFFEVDTVKSGRLASISRTELKSVIPCSWSSPWRLTRVGRM